MKKATAWIAAGLVLGATTGGSAQTIGGRAEEKARSAAAAAAVQSERERRTQAHAAAESVQAERIEITRPTRTRSRARTWTGIALAAAGAATALMGRTCRPMGSLPRESILPCHHEYITTSMTDLYAYEAGGACRIDFQIHVRVDDPVATSPSYHESHLYSELHHYTRRGLPDNLAGTARAKPGFDRGMLYIRDRHGRHRNRPGDHLRRHTHPRDGGEPEPDHRREPSQLLETRAPR